MHELLTKQNQINLDKNQVKVVKLQAMPLGLFIRLAVEQYLKDQAL